MGIEYVAEVINETKKQESLKILSLEWVI